MKDVIDAFGFARTPGTGDERHRADGETEHRDHQQEDELTRETEGRESLLRIDETTAHRGVDGKRDDAQHIQTDDRHGQIEEAPEDGAVDARGWT